MISTAVFIFLIIIVGVLTAYAMIYDSSYAYTDVLAMFGAAAISWVCALLFSSGNVGDSAYHVVSETVVENTTTFVYELYSVPIVDNTVSGILMITSIALTLLTFFISIKSIGEYLSGYADEEEEI